MSYASLAMQKASIHSEQPWFVLNAARQFSLHSSPLPSIAHIYSFEVGQAADTTLAIPDGCTDIVFDCDELAPNAQICGTTLTAQQTEFKHQHRYVGVRFVTGALPDFINLSAQDLIDHTYDFLDVMPQGEPLFEQIVSNHNFTDQVSAIENYLAPTQIRQVSPLTQQAIQSLCQHQGNMQIRELESITGVSIRTLQRQFQADIGISPKVFSRILRCQMAVHKINEDRHITFSDLAFELGFSDHSHFLREFKKLVSATPLSYQKAIRSNDYQQRICYL